MCSLAYSLLPTQTWDFPKLPILQLWSIKFVEIDDIESNWNIVLYDLQMVKLYSKHFCRESLAKKI